MTLAFKHQMATQKSLSGGLDPAEPPLGLSFKWRCLDATICTQSTLLCACGVETFVNLMQLERVQVHIEVNMHRECAACARSIQARSTASAEAGNTQQQIRNVLKTNKFTSSRPAGMPTQKRHAKATMLAGLLAMPTQQWSTMSNNLPLFTYKLPTFQRYLNIEQTYLKIMV